MNSTYSPLTARPRLQGGFSLVELMVAAAIGLLLVAVIGNVYLAGRQSFRDQDEASRLQESGRFVLNIVSRALHDTGRTDFGPANTAGVPPVYLVGSADFPIIPGAAVALDATDGAGPAPDTITVRCLSAILGELDCLGNNIHNPAVPPGAVVNPPVLVTQRIELNGTDLRCAVLSGAGAGQTQPLASDIEDFQIQLGIDNNNDGFVDEYAAPTTANAAISRSVSICILVRTADGMAPAAQQYIDCNGAVVNAAAGDRRIRRAFTTVISLRNRLG
ncbi:MAG: PilW family protein [Thiobacillus sp.]|nr:PilW family protein [Thiobacillus sp.]